MHDDGTPTGSVPSSTMTVGAPLRSLADVELFAAALAGLSLPARITHEVRTDRAGFVHGVIFTSASAHPLAVEADGALLRWTEVSATTVKIALASALGGIVVVDGVEYRLGGDRAPHPVATAATCPPAATVDTLAWFAPAPASTSTSGDLAGLVARAAGQPLHVVPDGAAALFSPTASLDAVVEQGAWASPGAVAFWRQGGARFAALAVENDVLVHGWDATWRDIDPVPVLRDADGMRVSDYLDALDGPDDIDPGTDAKDWSRARGLDDERAERLRILFRCTASDERTFERVAAILRLPAALSDIAEGRTAPNEVTGATVVQPVKRRAALRATLREKLRGVGAGRTPPRRGASA